MPKSCHCDHRLTFRRLPLGAFGKQDQDYYDDEFNPAGSTLARPHFGLENGVHLSVFKTAPLICKKCGGTMRVVSFITEPSVIRQILDHLQNRNNKDPVVSKNTNELKTRVRRDVSDRRVYAWFANGS